MLNFLQLSVDVHLWIIFHVVPATLGWIDYPQIWLCHLQINVPVNIKDQICCISVRNDLDLSDLCEMVTIIRYRPDGQVPLLNVILVLLKAHISNQFVNLSF